MKKEILKFQFLLVVLFTSCLFCYAQNEGIVSLSPNVVENVPNVFVYHPPKKMFLPDNLEGVVIFKNRTQFVSKYIPLKKIGSSYQFSFTPPDSTAVLIMGIVDGTISHADFSMLTKPKKNIIDNNAGVGYKFFLLNKNGTRYEDENIILAELLISYSRATLEVKSSFTVLRNLYDDTYKKHPQLMANDSYGDYLILLFNNNKDSMREPLITFARDLQRRDKLEKNLLNAIMIYQLLGMDEEKELLVKQILQSFPHGELAKQQFWSQFYANKDDSLDEFSVLQIMRNYMDHFEDSSESSKDKFYSKLISIAFSKQDWNTLLKYEQQAYDKFLRAYGNDMLARMLNTADSNKSPERLKIAKLLSRKSLQYLDTTIKNLKSDDGFDLVAARNKYYNTYASILYNAGDVDSAFYYQHRMYNLGDALNLEGTERYATYSQKIKGLEYTRKIIEKELLKGINSSILLAQLQSIYDSLSLPKNYFDTIKQKNNVLILQAKIKLIREKLGSAIAPNFKLKNVEGKFVELSSFLNKVVVLDFWATWCGPCKASFPEMQKLINRYQRDSTVEFLFIDVWEKKTPAKILQEVSNFLTDKKYNFNVLFDTKNEAVNAYKISEIPTKFVIDHKGEIVFIGNEINGLADIIEFVKRR